MHSHDGRKVGLGKAERRVLALRKRLGQVERELEEIEKEQVGDYFSDASIFSVFFFVVFVSMVASFGVVWSARYHMEKDNWFDLLAYAMPCFAAIVGGAGIYFRRHVTVAFIASGIFLLCGFVCYVLTKKAGWSHAPDDYSGLKLLAWTTGASTVAISSVTLFLVERWREPGKWKALDKKAQRRIFGWGLLSVFGLVVAAALAVLGWC